MPRTGRLVCVLIAAATMSIFSIVGSTAAPAAERFSTSTIATGLTSPWGLAFLPDGSALVSERDTGLIKRVTANGERVTTVGRVAGVRPSGEGGLLGIAVPDVPDPRFLFAYYTGARDNRVVRIDWDGTRLGRQTPIVTGIPKNTYHNGGRLLIGPESTLVIGTGDAGDPTLSQDPRSLAGKILRRTGESGPAISRVLARSPQCPRPRPRQCRSALVHGVR
jgi:glucose/arabinose dehydrogenase